VLIGPTFGLIGFGFKTFDLNKRIKQMFDICKKCFWPVFRQEQNAIGSRIGVSMFSLGGTGEPREKKFWLDYFLNLERIHEFLDSISHF
jgi:hypothetical protein